MHKMTIVGLVAILLTILYVLAVGNILHMLFNPLAIVIVYGGTFSAKLIAYPWSVIKEITPSLRIMLFPSKHSDQDMENKIDFLAKLAEKARRDGIETLASEIPAIDDKFLVHGIQMLVDGLEQDVIKDPPFSKLDLITCRNLLIYMGGELQQKLIPLFHYALNPGGWG